MVAEEMHTKVHIEKLYMHVLINPLTNVPESNGEWQDIYESIDLEDAEKEYSKMLECLSEEVPEET